MNSMITNMICYLKDQETDKNEKSAVSVREIFEKKAALYQDLIDKNKLTIAICGDVKLQTDAKMFGYIADNLVTNAVKYAKPETEVQIQIDKDTVTVRNQAAHIPDCTPEELWSPTRRGMMCGPAEMAEAWDLALCVDSWMPADIPGRSGWKMVCLK